MKWLIMPDLNHGLELETGLALAGIAFALVIGLIATLVLFISVKREGRRLALRERRRIDRELEAFREIIETVHSQNEKARGKEMSWDRASPSISDGFWLVEEMRLEKRAQALKRLRAGEPLDFVAREVKAPLCEIELLARVEEHVSDARARRNPERLNAAAVGTSETTPGVKSPNSAGDRSGDSDARESLAEDLQPASTSAAQRVRSAKAGAGKN